MSSTVNTAAIVSWKEMHSLWLGPMGEETSSALLDQQRIPGVSRRPQNGFFFFPKQCLSED